MPKISADARRDALRRFMASRNLKAKPWADRADVSANALYNFLAGRSDSLSVDTYDKLAQAERVPAFVLTGETSIFRTMERVQVVGEVQAGVWVEQYRWPEPEHYWVAVPVPVRYEGKAFGLMVRGPSMNLEYREGSIVVCVSLLDFHRDVRSGDHVVCEVIRRDGNREATVKELLIDENGKAWLWPRSTDPRFQQPIPANADGDADIETIQVSAVVVGSYNSRQID